MTTRWTDHELERFHDDDLAPATRDALRDDLMRDAALRERLSRVRAVDALVRDALTGETDPHARSEIADVAAAPSVRRPAWPKWSAVAAALLLAAAATVYTLSRRAAPLADVAPLADAAETTPDARDGLLIARFTLDAAAQHETADAAPNADEPAPPTLRASLETMLERGDLAGALALVLGAESDASRAEAWVAIGERVRTGAAAEELLDALPASAQVDVIGAWALRPSLRPASFERLARLSTTNDPDVRERVLALRDELSQHPDLRAWLMSYAAR